MSNDSKQPLWLPAALLLPVLLLAGLSVWLVRNEWRQQLEDTEVDARRVLESVARDVVGVEKEVVRVPGWVARREMPPTNGRLSAAWEAARAQMPKREPLDALLADPELEEAWTSTGISICMLANHARWQVAAAEEKEEWAKRAESAAWRHPNPLSKRIVWEVLGPPLKDKYKMSAERPRGEITQEREAAETMYISRRDLFLDEMLRIAQERQAVRTEFREQNIDAHAYATADGTYEFFFQNYSPTLERAPLHRGQQLLPDGFGISLWWHQAKVANSVPDLPEDEILAHHSWGDFTLQVSAHTEQARGQRQWERLRVFIVGLSVAVLATVVAMVAVWKSLRRQARLSQLQSEFVASVSHELRTPVASIGVLAERLEKGGLVAEKSDQYRRWIAREGRRLASLVENILDFSRIERNRKSYDKEPIDLPRLVTETVDILRPYAEEKQISLTAEQNWPTDAPQPEMDAGAIRQALVNLIENALKFTPSGGKAVVQLTYINNTVILSVSDTGCGIQIADQSHIFERFYRGQHPNAPETTGAGIGLSIVKHVVEGHGGRIDLVSKPNHGTTVGLVFPAPKP